MVNNTSLALSFEQMSGEALFDQDFVQALLQDPVQTLQGIGIEATEEILHALKKVDADSIMTALETFRRDSRLYQI